MGRPNVLLVTMDQLRADALSCAGHEVVRTPTLDRLATEGVRFANHFANCAPCAPGRASLLTGLWQMNHRVLENGAPLASDLPMLPQLLRTLGYRPALFGNTDTATDPRHRPTGDPALSQWWGAMAGFDVDVIFDGEFTAWTDWLTDEGHDLGERPIDTVYVPQDVPVPNGRGATWRPARYDADHTESAFITNRFLDWLDTTDADEPWCAHLSYFRPHPPYIAPEPYNDLYDPASVPAPTRCADRDDQAALHPFLAGAMAILPSPLDDVDQAQLQATYYGMVTEVDAQFGRVVDALVARGVLDDTVVVVTSDHGEQLGDHWLIEKVGYADPSYRIPLIVRWPQHVATPGRVVEAFTESVDVLPTLIDLLGGEVPDFCDGYSLRPFLEEGLAGSDAPDRWREFVVTEYDFRDPTSSWITDAYGLRHDQCGICVLRDHHGKYVHFGGYFPSLYFDLDTDPGELVNRAEDPAYTSVVLDYAQRMLDARMQHADARLTGYRLTDEGLIHNPDPPRPHHGGTP